MGDLVSFKLKPGARVHLVGIGGSGLSAIAQVLIGRGYKVSGSDEELNELTDLLSDAGATVYRGHDPANIHGADVVLISSAVPGTNPELTAARSAGIPVFKRKEFLGALLKGFLTIAVAGSHGKTTTTGMIAQILMTAGLDPSVIVGGKLPVLGGNGRAGKSEYFVIEADEYDGMFLGLSPKIAVITNVEYDHPDQYPTEEAYRTAFSRFVSAIKPDGRLILCADDAGARKVAQESQINANLVEQYGQETGEWRALDLRTNQHGGTDFLIENREEILGLARLRVPGDHNVGNALAAAAVAANLGVDFNSIRDALAEFGGVGRRFQVIGEYADVAVVDDYAHHPTEIKATLAAARKRYPGRRVWAVWQPHTFSRTSRLIDSFAKSFADADKVIVLDVFASRETDSLGVNIEDVAASIDESDAKHIGDLEEAASYILERVKPGDVIVTLTAGDGNRVGHLIVEDLRRRRNGDVGATPIAPKVTNDRRSVGKTT